MKTKSYQLRCYGTEPEPVTHELRMPEGRELVLEVEFAGVCHSDVYIMEGYQDLGDGERIDFAESSMPIPLTMGHEIVGRVVAAGPDADPSLIGARRLVYPWIGCGRCRSCRAGFENHCETPGTLGIFAQGGYARHVIVPEGRYLVDIGGIDPAWASTLACSGLTVFSALRQLMPVKPESSIAIIGAGGLGLMAVAVAKALGLEKIIVCDVSDDRLTVAQELGASAVVNTQDAVDVSATLREASEDSLYGVLDTVGLPATMNLAIDSVMKGAKIVLIGLQGGRIPLPLPTLPFKALSLIGTYTGSLGELEALVALAREGRLEAMPVWRREMSCLCDSLTRLKQRQVVGRIVLSPETV
ncbi:zinc-binding dehydrogenase [Martelella alba]|uniref:Zinc-binding dehydrogenase n=1 Tax=Martelella alba TaxID=2590451 RepID=A0A506UFE7_9HYPH|nr:alcohol dehydrogenase [Martelella alba]TPW31569.1 zinc-binding dehydrogenase [Martelella alba]